MKNSCTFILLGIFILSLCSGSGSFNLPENTFFSFEATLIASYEEILHETESLEVIYQTKHALSYLRIFSYAAQNFTLSTLSCNGHHSPIFLINKKLIR